MRRRVQSFEQLDVYQAAVQLQRRVFELSRSWPKQEAYALTDQVRRSSRSIGANLAEAWAKRRYELQFVNKLTEADAEQNETRHWLRSALDCTYVTLEQHHELEQGCHRIGAMLGRMMAESHIWTV